jgi:hypothetical protein
MAPTYGSKHIQPAACPPNRGRCQYYWYMLGCIRAHWEVPRPLQTPWQYCSGHRRAGPTTKPCARSTCKQRAPSVHLHLYRVLHPNTVSKHYTHAARRDLCCIGPLHTPLISTRHGCVVRDSLTFRLSRGSMTEPWDASQAPVDHTFGQHLPTPNRASHVGQGHGYSRTRWQTCNRTTGGRRKKTACASKPQHTMHGHRTNTCANIASSLAHSDLPLVAPPAQHTPQVTQCCSGC